MGIDESKPSNNGAYLRLCVTLIGSDPLIWRRFLLRSDGSFTSLNEAIQACGWTDSHLWEFVDERAATPKTIAGLPFDDEFGDPTPDASGVPLSAHFEKAGDRCTYIYDFGDDWRHLVVLEGIEQHNQSFQRGLLDGEGKFPPEDCGGMPGFERLCEFVRTGKDPWDDGETLREWLDETALGEFDLEQARRSFGSVLPNPSPAPPPSASTRDTLVPPPPRPTLELDRAMVDIIVDRLDKTLEDLANELDLSTGIRRVSFNQHNAKIELEFATIREDNVVMNKQAVEFLQRCHEFGLEPSHLGREFHANDDLFRVLGLRPRAKLPILCKRSHAHPLDGARFGFAADVVARQLRADEGAGPALRLLEP